MYVDDAIGPRSEEPLVVFVCDVLAEAQSEQDHEQLQQRYKDINHVFGHYISRESKTTRNVLWSRASVCVSVCLSAAACLQYCTDPDVTWGSGRGCPLVVNYRTDLQSVHGNAFLWQHYGNAWQSPAVIRQA